jgi:hypothetical protein
MLSSSVAPLGAPPPIHAPLDGARHVLHSPAALPKSKPVINHQLETAKNTLSGLAGGMACVVAGHPLDTCKVLLQTQPHRFARAAQAFSFLLRDRGVRRGLYSGAVPALYANAAENAMLFGCYGTVQETVNRLWGGHESPMLLGAACGSIAGGLVAFVLTPIELLKCRMQVHGGTGGAGLLRTAVNIVQHQGVGGLFRGLSWTLAREISGNAGMFGAYEGAKAVIAGYDIDRPILSTLVAGGIGGLGFWSLALPFDGFKTRAQVGISAVGSQGGSWLRNLYRGGSPVFLRAFVANAALFGAVESVVYIFTHIETHGLDLPNLPSISGPFAGLFSWERWCTACEADSSYTSVAIGVASTGAEAVWRD